MSGLNVCRRKLRFSCAWGIAIIVATPCFAQRVILSEDFEGDAPGAFPASADFFAKSSVLNLSADFDGDVRVDGSDFLILQRGFPAGTSRQEGDADGDGDVDDADFRRWESEFGKNDPAGVLVTGGAVPDPFDPGNNQSLAIRNPNGSSQMAVTWADEFSDDPNDFRNGTIEFDLWMETPDPDAFWTFFSMRSGHGDATRTGVSGTQSDTTVWNTFRLQNNPAQGATDVLEQLSDPGHLITFGVEGTYNDDNSVPDAGAFGPDQPISVRYEIEENGHSFFDLPTYRLYLNDVQIEWSGTVAGASDEHPWTLGLGPSLAPGINIISFFTDASAFTQNQMPGTGNVYIDNLVVTNNDLPPLGSSVPESSSALLVFTGAVSALAARLRLSRHN